MPAKVLTDAAVRRFKPSSKRREIPDARAAGLYLVIQSDRLEELGAALPPPRRPQREADARVRTASPARSWTAARCSASR